jgi:N-acetylglucosamine kinase-like BadF-type ATPase
MLYYIGVDGGGTKTAICLAAADASVLLSEVTDSASWREYGVDSVIGNIRKVIRAMPVEADGQIAGIAMGLPCFGESENGDWELEKAVCEAFPGIPAYITNDAEVGWAGSLGLSPGVNVVAGTGSIAFGKNESGETARSGGWSEFFSDEGSCYWVGRKLMQLFAKQADGRIPKDELYTIVRNELKLRNDFEFIDLMHSEYMPNRDKVATLQLLARDAALAGSPSAVALYREAADELCCLVASIKNRLLFSCKPFPVSYSGGLYKTGELILPHFFKGIEALGGKPVVPRYEPMYGALLLAFERNCPAGLSALYKRLDIE